MGGAKPRSYIYDIKLKIMRVYLKYLICKYFHSVTTSPMVHSPKQHYCSHCNKIYI